ncbi:hypothetical protein ATANTOWER_021442, partial [Ataeniobius toweri]|nr:hypothetical protein [Ataeniobius toweri]
MVQLGREHLNRVNQQCDRKGKKEAIRIKKIKIKDSSFEKKLIQQNQYQLLSGGGQNSIFSRRTSAVP